MINKKDKASIRSNWLDLLVSFPTFCFCISLAEIDGSQTQAQTALVFHLLAELIMFGLPPIVSTIGLLVISNVFMTFAWYAHLRELEHKPWIVAALLSWGIALFEYMFQVPANRIGYTVLNLGQLKILQEVITLSVFVPFALIYMKEPFRMDFIWAGLCLLGAVFFIFRPQIIEVVARALA